MMGPPVPSVRLTARVPTVVGAGVPGHFTLNVHFDGAAGEAAAKVASAPPPNPPQVPVPVDATMLNSVAPATAPTRPRLSKTAVAGTGTTALVAL